MASPNPQDPRRTATISGFRGLNERRIVGADPRETSSLDNVTIKDGVVTGRGGSSLYGSVSTQASNYVIGMWQYDDPATNAGTLLRMTADKIYKWTGAAWSDISGSALTGSATTRPQACMVGEISTFVMVNEGHDRPRKWAGSGNTAALGGTPPYAKSCEFWKGFLGLGNISTDGITFSPLDLILSDAPDSIWTECDDTEVYVTTLTIDETPGSIVALKVLGDELLVYKTDGIVAIAFTGGPTRFRRRKLDFPMGILAPLSLQGLPGQRHIFLAEDRNIYITNGQTVEQLPRNFYNSLHDDLTLTKAPWAVGVVNEDNETYSLFYERGGTNYNKGRLIYNYSTGEFSRALYPFEVSSAWPYRSAPSDSIDLVAGAWDATDGYVVYQLDTTDTQDDSRNISRYIDMDWSQYGVQGDKYLLGAEFVFEKAAGARAKISVGIDKSSAFQFAKVFNLKGSDPDETQVRVSYRVPSPLYGSWFKFRVQLYHDVTAAEAKLMEFEPEFIPMAPVQEDSAPKSQAGRF